MFIPTPHGEVAINDDVITYLAPISNGALMVHTLIGTALLNVSAEARPQVEDYMSRKPSFVLVGDWWVNLHNYGTLAPAAAVGVADFPDRFILVFKNGTTVWVDAAEAEQIFERLRPSALENTIAPRLE